MNKPDPIVDNAPAILDALSARGIASSYVQMHGIATLHITETVHVNTGLHSWAYGSASRLDAEGVMFEPAEDIDEYATLDIDEDETDPETVAEAWAIWAVKHFPETTEATPAG